MTNVVQVIPHLSFTIEVKHDQDFNFVRDFGTAGVMVCWHRKYRLGHIQPTQTREEWMREKLQDWYHDYLTSHRKFDAQTYHDYCCKVNYMEWDELIAEFEKHHVYVFLFFLDHSSQAIQAGNKGVGWDHWDSGWVGFMYMDQSTVFDHFGFRTRRLDKRLRAKAIEWMTEEVEDYNTYLQQEVYCYDIKQGDEVWYEGEGGWLGSEGIKQIIQESQWEIEKPKCDQCKLMSATMGGTSAIFHEVGCIHDGKQWDPNEQRWLQAETENIDQEEE